MTCYTYTNGTINFSYKLIYNAPCERNYSVKKEAKRTAAKNGNMDGTPKLYRRQINDNHLVLSVYAVMYLLLLFVTTLRYAIEWHGIVWHGMVWYGMEVNII
uniref:Uncharacterized protein n=1 Tax=Glossina palpalis gambiensis TaxID=67801 RepID=A0A1B0B1T5_9MUSC